MGQMIMLSLVGVIARNNLDFSRSIYYRGNHHTSTANEKYKENERNYIWLH